ncbi:hypothetical protein KDN24_06400 [Bacillus sp. Bva_UNVM-123]|uniref:hypothetical protein n=1 Tax=Bacillus sp. Bva_UNVM-123 TaxID=2829798 RepID=UPI00391FB4E5
MNALMSREEMIKKYANGEREENYIYNLSDEVYEQVADAIEFMEGDQNTVTFMDIMEQAMVTCIHKFDFRTKDMIEFRFPKVNYEMMHFSSSNCDYEIEKDSEGYVVFKISMTPEQHMIMTLLDTLEDFEEYFYTEAIADRFELIVKDN